MNLAYSNLAIEAGGTASEVPDSVRKAIDLMKEVKENTLDDRRALGMAASDADRPADLNAINAAYMERIAKMGLQEESVVPLRGLVASLRSVTLRSGKFI